MKWIKGLFYSPCTCVLRRTIMDLNFNGTSVDRSSTETKQEFIERDWFEIWEIFERTPTYKFIKWIWGPVFAVTTFIYTILSIFDIFN